MKFASAVFFFIIYIYCPVFSGREDEQRRFYKIFANICWRQAANHSYKENQGLLV